MIELNLFEEMLATYPVEKRELARQVYHRFADGDSSNFFTQLFIVLDVYAHYAARIPKNVIEANRNALESPKTPRAVTLDGKNLSDFQYSAKEKLLWIHFENDAAPHELSVQF